MPFVNLLLIDDDEDDQEIFLTALSGISGSAKCTTFSNAREALEKLAKKHVNPDVIFLDLNMPLMNGQQFLTEIKKIETLKNIPVIIFSTSSQSSTKQQTKELGAYDFITKPDTFAELVQILKPMIG
jgi:CheY-like chemotaxis protein